MEDFGGIGATFVHYVIYLVSFSDMVKLTKEILSNCVDNGHSLARVGFWEADGKPEKTDLATNNSITLTDEHTMAMKMKGDMEKGLWVDDSTDKKW